MQPFRRILVAIQEPGASALPTVAKAARIARACGAHLELFHSIKASVFANSPAAYEEALLDLHETQRNHYLQRSGGSLHGCVSTASKHRRRWNTTTLPMKPSSEEPPWSRRT